MTGSGARYRLVALDIDGTIIGPDLVVSDRLRAAVKSTQAAGARVLLATGRIRRSALRFSRALEATGPLICYQGAVTADPLSGAVRRHARLDPALAVEALETISGAAGGAGADVTVLLDDEIYVERRSEWSAGYAERMGQELRVVESLAALADGQPTLILAVNHPAATAKLAESLKNRFDSRALVTHSIPTFCEVASPDAGKVAALDDAVAGLGIVPEQVVAFGDGAGDAGMLAWAGLGVAVGAAHTETAAASDTSVAGPEVDGVAQALEELLARGLLGADG